MHEVTLEARDENLSRALAFVDGQLEALGCSLKIQTQIDIAVEELFVNIAHYAYPSGTGSATLRFDVEPSPRCVVITFTDSGVPYDPLAKADPDVTLPAEERMIGGLGIFLVKKNTDDIKYEYLDGHNILRIKKRLT